MKPLLAISMIIFSLVYSWTCFAGDTAYGGGGGTRDPYEQLRLKNSTLKDMIFDEDKKIADANELAIRESKKGSPDQFKKCFAAIDNGMFKPKFQHMEYVKPDHQIISSKTFLELKYSGDPIKAMDDTELEQLRNGLCVCDTYAELKRLVSIAKEDIKNNKKILKNNGGKPAVLTNADLSCD